MQQVNSEQVESVVHDALESFGANPTDIRPEAALEELNVDSLDLVELGQILEDECGIQVVADDFQGVKTVGDAMAVIRRHIS